MRPQERDSHTISTRSSATPMFVPGRPRRGSDREYEPIEPGFPAFAPVRAPPYHQRMQSSLQNAPEWASHPLAGAFLIRHAHEDPSFLRPSRSEAVEFRPPTASAVAEARR